MNFYFYDEFEERYHNLDSPTCSCKPRTIRVGDDALIVHSKLVDTEKPWTEAEIAEAVAGAEAFQQLCHQPNLCL